MRKENSADLLLEEIRNSNTCRGCYPPGSKPLLNFSSKSKIMIVGQAPGIKAIESKTPWNDASGERLRAWMGISKEEFYNADICAIVPMDFCYPGKGKSGDLPPRSECAKRWMEKIRAELKELKLTILIGQYAQKYFLKDKRKENLTTTVKSWEKYTPKYFVLPHPSPRNNIWLRKNSWFEQKLLPTLKKRVKKIIIK